MIVTAVDDGSSAGGTADFAAALVRLLTGRSPDHAVSAGDPVAPAVVARSTVVVLTVSVDGGTVPSEVLALADARPFAPGALVVPASVGPWPADAVTLDHALVPRLTDGRTCITPVLHVPSADAPAVGLYCRRWAPVVAWLAGLAAGSLDGRAA
jgi:hypothetical protein